MIDSALQRALQAASVLSITHLWCVSVVMYLDLSGKWAKYSMNKNRDVSYADYASGMKSFTVDLCLLFVPFMTLCFWYSADAIDGCVDTLPVSLAKLAAGYVLGKIWACAVHYALHSPLLYRFHKRHHCDPKKVVASAAWEDSFVEYAIMELPSFAITIILFPTHLWTHLMHFAWHGYDGCAGHSGFAAAPGLLGYLFDGEYHYYHHAHLNVNYAEIEFLDKLCGTHHSQKQQKNKKTC